MLILILSVWLFLHNTYLYGSEYVASRYQNIYEPTQLNPALLAGQFQSFIMGSHINILTNKTNNVLNIFSGTSYKQQQFFFNASLLNFTSFEGINVYTMNKISPHFSWGLGLQCVLENDKKIFFIVSGLVYNTILLAKPIIGSIGLYAVTTDLLMQISTQRDVLNNIVNKLLLTNRLTFFKTSIISMYYINRMITYSNFSSFLIFHGLGLSLLHFAGLQVYLRHNLFNQYHDWGISIQSQKTWNFATLGFSLAYNQKRFNIFQQNHEINFNTYVSHDFIASHQATSSNTEISYTMHPKDYITPNANGLHDFLTINFNHSDYSTIRLWNVVIKDSRGNIIAIIKPDTLSLNGEGEFNFPKTIVWNGRNANGNIAPDGNYSIEFQAQLSNNKIVKQWFLGMIQLSTSEPKFFYHITDHYLSLDNFYKFTCYLTAKSKIKFYEITMYKNNHKMGTRIIHSINQRTMLGDTFFRAYKFDDGDSFHFKITAIDKYLNRWSQITHPVYVIKHKPDVRLTFAYDFFSPNGDGVRDALPMFAEWPKNKIIASWELVCFSKETHTLVMRQHGKNNLSKQFTWNGLNTKGFAEDVGQYIIILRLNFTDKTHAESIPHLVHLAKHNLHVSIWANDEGFTPDNNSQNETTKIYIRSYHDLILSSYRLHITNELGDTIKRISGSGFLPPFIIWDGSNEGALLLENQRYFKIMLLITDVAGNQGSSNTLTIFTYPMKPILSNGITLLDPNLRFPAIYFSSGSVTPNNSALVMLQTISHLIKSTKNVQIIIHGYADTQGTDKYNLSLSYQRAMFVQDYLLGLGIKHKIKIHSKGETSPIVQDNQGRVFSANRRVEVVLRQL